ncbi:MAG: biotin-dependent carboxyltransferase family protein [Pseudohongiellaceae bacterium]
MFEVLRCGPLTTVQDQGRHGLRHLGVGQSGCLDPVAAAQANLLLGNARQDAVLEVLHFPLLLACHSDCDIALSGDDTDARLIDQHRQPIPEGRLLPGFVHRVRQGQLLLLPGRRQPRTYAVLGMAGGIDVPEILGSRSTDLNNRFGGLEGRPVQSGDRIHVSHHADAGRRLLDGIRSIGPTGRVRAIPGPEFERFTPQARMDLWQTRWTVGRQCNRMGLRLSGMPLQGDVGGGMPSSAVLPGVIQVPPDGRPIILANDAQTTGGYPRIASIITADLWQLAYLGPGSRIRLEQVSVEEAQTANREWQRYWSILNLSASGEGA